MSVYLTLLPLWGKGALEGKQIFCSTQLHLTSDYEDLFPQLSDAFGTESVLVTFPLPEGKTLQFYGENGLEETRECSTGGLIHFAYAGDFRRVKVHGPASENKAAIAYCATLPKDTPVFLNWG